MVDDLAHSALHALVGDGAEFRPGQLDAIRALVDERRRVLCVQRTGWGKSVVYFVATMLLRAEGAGPTLLVSPLLSLMRNQIDAATRGGVRAATINSDNTDLWDKVVDDLTADRVDLLLISPERFANPKFRDTVLPVITKTVGLFVIDEAHCISDWGHDFRPDYRRLARIVEVLPQNVPVLCTTATANDRVVADIVAQLGEDLLVVRGTLDRTSLALDVVHLPMQAERLSWLLQALPRIEGCGIVYALTVRDANLVAEWLTANGIAAAAYFGGEESESKKEVERRLIANELKAVVATSALGMGYDKPDLAFVIHFQSPGSVIAYYQQVGRAGRAIDTAVGILLCGREDAEIQDWFINTAFPPEHIANGVVSALESADGPMGIAALETAVNVRRTRLTNMLKQLEVDGAVEKDGAKYRRTSDPWEYPKERVEHITAQRRAEQQQMREYASGKACLMQQLRAALDDPHDEPCGRCSHCVGHSLLTIELDTADTRRAVQFLRGHSIDIEPRRRTAANTGIPKELQVEPGKALCQWGDGGWGELVRDGRAAGEFAPELVDALARLVRTWRPDPKPTWITAVPSLRQPELVHNFTRQLAVALGLEYRPVVRKIRETAPQADMENSAQQAGNVEGAFEIAGEVSTGPVLLVDDLIDSRWTITTIGTLLREAGSGPARPVALAQGTGD
jgi:ATP-dependent DNA helicase RecQ